MAELKKNVALFIVVLIGVLMCLPFIQPIANQVSMSSNNQLVRNLTVTPAAENVTLNLPHRTLVTSISILNSTNITAVNLVGANLVTFIGSDGLQSVGLVLNGTAPAPYKTGSGTLNISYIAQPDDYVDSGSQAMLGSLVIFLSIGLAMWVFVLIFKSEMMQKILRRS